MINFHLNNDKCQRYIIKNHILCLIQFFRFSLFIKKKYSVETYKDLIINILLYNENSSIWYI